MVTPAGTGTAERVRDVVAPVVEAAGLYLEGVSVSPAGRRSLVRITVDLDEDAIGSLGSEALGEVSQDISTAMDTADPVRGQYVLEVSTPGTDRPLTTLRHLRRARTRLVSLVLRDGTSVQGRLVDASAEGYDVATADGDVRRIQPVDLVRGSVEVELSRATSAEDAADEDAADEEEV
jgi:ribosome maturation factor RimP